MWLRSVVVVSLLVAGCAAIPRDPSSSTQGRAVPTTAASTEPLGRQVARVAEKLHADRFSGLLHFEKNADELFLASEPQGARVERGASHTGRSSLQLPPAARRLTVKLSSLLAGRAFPGEWTLVGLYVRSEGELDGTIVCELGGTTIASRKLTLQPGQWTPAMLDLSTLPSTPMPPAGEITLELRFDRPATNVRCDDVLLIDNRQTLVDAAPQSWTIVREGLRITCDRKLRFNFSVVTTDGSPVGWAVEEANELRSRFSSTGETKALTLYADGRALWDGVYKPLSAEVRDDRSFGAAHESPATIAVPETMGRLNRSTPGDADNDGYNEQLGAYQIEAAGGRLEMTIRPGSTVVPRPVLQIAGMPQGKALITIEGRLVERSTRLEDGALLIELPARITRPMLVTVRIQ